MRMGLVIISFIDRLSISKSSTPWKTMAFTLSTPLSLRPTLSLLKCNQRPLSVRRPRRPVYRPMCSYATDLQTRTANIAPSATDSLLERVRETLAQNKLVPEADLQEMVLHLADTRGMTRLELVNTFGSIGAVATPALLTGLETCPNPVVRRSCGKALAQIGDSRATQPLIAALLGDPDTVTRASAAGALAKIGASAVPALLDVLASPDSSNAAKGHVAWALAYMQGDSGSAQALLDAARHEVDDVRLAVVSALGAVLLGDALPIMGDAAERSEWEEDEGESSAKDAVLEAAEKVLRDALGDRSAAVRAEAVNVLASGGKGDYVDAVCEMLQDEDAETRRAAALGLMKMGDARVLPVLKKLVEDSAEVEQVKSVAKLALRSLGRSLEQEEDDY